jgi:hypothetical protein
VSYDELCNSNGCRQLKYAKGHDGLGVLIRDFGGDGDCVVSTRRDAKGLVAEVKIRTPWGGKPVGKSCTVGVVGIDSGQFIITDPCYILPNKFES